jgi:hypothetical protein
VQLVEVKRALVQLGAEYTAPHRYRMAQDTAALAPSLPLARIAAALSFGVYRGWIRSAPGRLQPDMNKIKHALQLEDARKAQRQAQADHQAK